MTVWLTVVLNEAINSCLAAYWLISLGDCDATPLDLWRRCEPLNTAWFVLPVLTHSWSKTGPEASHWSGLLFILSPVRTEDSWWDETVHKHWCRKLQQCELAHRSSGQLMVLSATKFVKSPVACLEGSRQCSLAHCKYLQVSACYVTNLGSKQAFRR